MIKILLVDDQELVRRGLERILNQEPDLQVVGECEDGDQVLESVKEHAPSIVLMDVRMKRKDGISATRDVKTLQSPPPVMMLTTFSDDDVLWNALDAGAAGFVLKDATPEDIIRATTVIAGGGAWLDPAVTQTVITHYRRSHHATAQGNEIQSLTARERDVLLLIAGGYLNQEIAEKLFVSEATVKTHISHIFNKIGARDRAAAIVFAYDHGIVIPRGRQSGR